MIKLPFSGDAYLILGHSNEFKQHYQVLSLAFQKSVDQLIVMPMKDIVEHGTALCTSVLLDGVVLKAGSLFVSASGRATRKFAHDVGDMGSQAMPQV